MAQSPPVSSGHVLKAAGAMGAATFLSRIMGLVREQVFAIFFGAGNLTDAFNVAFRIPNLLRDLFAEGAMSASLVPTFTRARVEEGDQRAWRIAGLVFRVLFFTVSIISCIGVLFAPQLVELYASAFHQIPGKFELTVRMTRIMFPFFPLVALAAAFMGILNACGVFFLPAFASALFNVTSVLVGVLFSQVFLFWGQGWGVSPIEGMAIGVVAGGMVQAFCQLPTLYKKGYRWHTKTPKEPSWSQDPRLKQMLWMMVPGTIGLAATQVNILVNTVLATSQGPGAVSWLNYSFRLMQFPIGIFGVSLASATLPRISYQWAHKDIDGVSGTLTSAIRSVMAINLPASAGLAFLGTSIIELIFQYGRFYYEDTRATALALAMYAIGLSAYSAVKVLVPACYALNNTRLPVISSILSVLVTIILNLLMVGPFGYWGLALGTSVAAIFNAVFLLFSIQKLIQSKGGAFSTRPILRGLFEYLFVALLMGGICWLTQQFLETYLNDEWFLSLMGKAGLPLGRGLKMAFLIAEGVLIVILTARVLHLKEAVEIINLFTNKLKNKLRRSST
jgi:putative peptidoglycan lipid II flippase